MNLYKVTFEHIPTIFYVTSYDKDLAVRKAYEKLRDRGYHEVSLKSVENVVGVAFDDNYAASQFLG